jgi:hypothetical protein
VTPSFFRNLRTLVLRASSFMMASFASIVTASSVPSTYVS